MCARLCARPTTSANGRVKMGVPFHAKKKRKHTTSRFFSNLSATSILMGSTCATLLKMKRPRYADIYFEAYHSFSLPFYIRRKVRQFRRSPQHYLHVPLYIKTMVTTQSFVKRQSQYDRQKIRDSIDWALAVVSFMRRRAAFLVTRCALEFIYNPNGPWLRRERLQYTSL